MSPLKSQHPAPGNEPYRLLPAGDYSDAQLREQFAALAQEITRRLASANSAVKAQFPRGCIRPLADVSRRWPYLSNRRKRTLACYIQLCDINRWHLNVWDLALTAGTMWVWHATVPVICVVESLILEYGYQQGWLTPETRFKKAINTLQSRGVYTAAFRDKLHALRDYRNQVHAYLREHVEMHDGLPRRYNEAVLALQQLEAALLAHWQRKREQVVSQ